MPDFWADNAPTADEIAAEFQKDAGRAPTQQEAAFYGDPGNAATWRDQIQANSQAPNGYATIAAGGTLRPTGNDFGALPPVYTPEKPLAAPAQVVAPPGGGGYSLPAWTGGNAPTFTAPTGLDEISKRDYDFRAGQGRNEIQRAAAARGSVLNPGTVSALTERAGQQASQELSNTFARAHTTFADALESYKTNYGVYSGNAGLGMQAAGLNANIGNVGFGNQVTAANTNTDNAVKVAGTNAAIGQGAYATNFNANETASTDYWNRLRDLANAGQQAATSVVTA